MGLPHRGEAEASLGLPLPVTVGVTQQGPSVFSDQGR